MRLGERFLAEKLISDEQLQEALEAQVVHGGRLGTNLVELGFLKEADLARALGQMHGCPYASGDMMPDPQALVHVDIRFMDEHDILPMRVDATRLTAAVINPHQFRPLETLAFKSGKRVVAVVIPEFCMNQLLRRYAEAWRPMRALDMHLIKPAKREQERAAEAATAPDLMSEEEFQLLYAQALSGGADVSAGELPILEGEVLPEEDSSALPPGSVTVMNAPGRPSVLQASQTVALPAPQAAPAQRSAAAVRASGLRAEAREKTSGVERAESDVGPFVLQPTPTAGSAPAPAFAPVSIAPRSSAPVLPEAPDLSPLTFTAAQAMLVQSSDREGVARTILRYAQSKWRRALLLSVQGELVTGWAGLGEGIRESAIRRIGIALRGQSTFKLVRDLRSHYAGPMKRDAGAVVFYKLLGRGFPTTAVLLPLLVRGKVVHLLYVDNGPGEVTPPDVGELLILSQGVARSYEAMIRRRQKA